MPPFRLACEKLHLTYKGHVDFQTWKDFYLSTWGETKLYSFVHEVGDEHEDCPTPYEHTHIFLWMKKRFDTTNPRFFDIAELDSPHPNYQNKRSLEWARTICLKYHLGHKTKKGGTKYFIEPVFLHQEGVEDWKIEHDMWQIAVNAPTLVDACEDLGIVPKSASDVKIARSEKKRKHDTLDEGLSRDQFKMIDPWPVSAATRRVQAIVGRGPMGIGKTNWAIAQFERPFKVEDIDELKEMPPDTDGIVFDECLFDACPKGKMICLTDYNQPRTVRCRNVNARIPAKLKKIFLCNEHEHPFGDNPNTGGHASVLDRIVTMELTAESVRA